MGREKLWTAEANDVSRLPPLPRGDRNCNPPGVGLLRLLREDFVCHDSSLLEPGFWAVAVHRFGNWRMGIRQRPLRAPLSVLHKTAQLAVDWGLGIKLDYTVKLGRRVRLWHHGGMVLGAREIGDDVHIRQNTTLGVARRSETNGKPIIGNGVDIGAGACVLGQVHVGDRAVIGANAVVIADVAANTTVAGVPAKVVQNHKKGAG